MTARERGALCVKFAHARLPRIRIIKIAKTGPLMRAVTIPTGSSRGSNIVRAAHEVIGLFAVEGVVEGRRLVRG